MRSGAFRSELEKLLADDVPHGDLTTEALGIGDLEGEMVFSARDSMVLAEAESAAGLLEMTGCQVSLRAGSGDQLAPGSTILVARGTARALHRGWKVAQTLIENWSGVATVARAIVDAATAVTPHVVVACTRKNIPGTKSFAVRAVRAGGAVVHRLGLSDSVLVFPEHQVFMVGAPLAEAIKSLRSAAPEKKLVIEATSLEDALAAAEAGFDVIQAEKFGPREIAGLVRELGGGIRRPLIAAAGGINAANAAAYAQAGADILVTSAPYLARPCDVQVRVLPAAKPIVPAAGAPLRSV
jgi:molybdenum transport protein